jgi:leader peptidase (prepilin peptidase)/N-methyltransferase
MTEALLAFLFGLLIGSFLNVCIHRWPRGRSVVRPRSHCVRCRKMIPWYDNIPLLSYLLLRGRCRYCGRRISLRYPVVEALTGGIFFYFVLTLGPTPAAAKLCVFSAMLVALVFSDLEKRILPDEFTLGGAVIGMIFAAVVAVPDSTAQMLLWLAGVDVPAGRGQWLAEAAFAAIVPAAILWAGGEIYAKVRHRPGLGLGDVKLVAMMGSFLGLRLVLLAMVAGSLGGSVIGIAYIWATHRKAATYELPFGTFLGAAGLLVAIVSKGSAPL